MKISTRLSRILSNNLCAPHMRYGRGVGDVSQNLKCNIFVKPHLKDNIIEIPAFVSCDFINNIDNNIDSLNSYCMPLGLGLTNNYKTIDVIISNILGRRPSVESEIFVSRSDKYGNICGCEGMLLDKDLNPLLLTVLGCSNTDGGLEYEYFKVYVNPKVSLMETDLDKHIYTKIVPYCMTNSLFMSPSRKLIINKRVGSRVLVEFKDVKDVFFVKPSIPQSEDYNKEISKLLIDNVDFLVETAKTCL